MIKPLKVDPNINHAYHLYVIRWVSNQAGMSRAAIFKELRSLGIGVNVHYIPVHLHPFYRRRFGTGPGLCPIAEMAYKEILTLPMYPAMTDGDVKFVIDTTESVASKSLVGSHDEK